MGSAKVQCRGDPDAPVIRLAKRLFRHNSWLVALPDKSIGSDFTCPVTA